MRQENIVIVKSIRDIIEESNSFFLISYKGLVVAKQEELKKSLRDKGSVFQVHKNKLIQKAAEGQAYSDISECEISEGTAIVTVTEEAPEIAKIIKNFAKENKAVQFKASFVDGQVLSSEESEEIAKLPTKDVARAQLLGVLNASSQNLVNVLNAKVASVLNVLNAYKEKKEASE